MENESSTWYTIYQMIWVSVGLDSYLGTNFAAAVDELIKVDDRFFLVSVFCIIYTAIPYELSMLYFLGCATHSYTNTKLILYMQSVGLFWASRNEIKQKNFHCSFHLVITTHAASPNRTQIGEKSLIETKPPVENDVQQSLRYLLSHLNLKEENDKDRVLFNDALSICLLRYNQFNNTLESSNILLITSSPM